MLYFAKEVNPVFVGAIIGLFSLVALVGRVLLSTCRRYWNSVKQHRGVKIMDAPGSSLAPCFYPQKASCNRLRLCLLFTLLCDDLFRDILSRYIKPIYLRPKLDINKQKLVKHFNKQQQNLIYPTTGNTSLTAKDFDISTIYILLRNICNIPSHKAGWGNLPVKGDNSIAAGIEIIRLTRNSIVHSTNGMIEDLVFEKHWKELRDAVVQIETQLTGSDLYKRGVDFLYSCNLIAVGTEAYQNEEKCKQDSVERAARFAEFFDELAESVPVEKIARLKDFIQNNCKAEDIATIKQAVSARDCLRYLRDEKRFTSSDVMFVQYLFKRIDCKELFVKCYKYAEKQEALCFYEKPPANGYKNVLFHVKGNLSDYSRERIAEIRETLAVLLNCNSKEILIGGACPSASFLLVLSIKDAYSYKLLALEQCDKDKLTKLDIDYIIVDLTVINLEPSKEYGWNIYFDPKHFNRKEYENLLSQEEKSTVSPLQYITTVFQETESSSDEVSKDSSSRDNEDTTPHDQSSEKQITPSSPNLLSDQANRITWPSFGDNEDTSAPDHSPKAQSLLNLLSGHANQITSPSSDITSVSISSGQSDTNYYLEENAEIRARFENSSAVRFVKWKRETDTGSHDIDETLPKYRGTLHGTFEQLHDIVLKITSCDESDAGTYFLIVYCTDREICSNKIHLQVFKGSPIVTQYGSEVEAYLDGSVRIVALIRGFPRKYEFIWKKENQKLYITDPKYKGSKNDVTFAVLQINKIKKEDEGTYTIEVQNELGQGQSSQKLVVVKGLSEVTLNGVPPVHLNESVELKATFQNVSKCNRLSVIWVQHDQDINNPHRKYEVTIDKKGSAVLYIKNVKKEDVGTYTVKVHNEFGKGQSSQKLEVIRGSLLVTLKEVPLAYLNECVKLKAKIEGFTKTPCVNWIKDDQDIDIRDTKYEGSKYNGDSAVLCINDVKENDEAIYTIKVSSELEKVKRSQKLVVIKEGEMIFISGPVVVLPSDTIIFHAFMPNQNFSNMKWWKIKDQSNKEVEIGSGKYSVIYEGGNIYRFEIFNAEKEDSAAYQCSADNMKSNTIYVHVDEFEEFSNSGQGNVIRFNALQSVSAKVMRKVINSLPNTFEENMNKVKTRCNSYARQTCAREFLSINTINSSEDLDISKMYTMYRNLNLNGRNWKQQPEKNDIHQADDIERIRYYRNCVCHSDASEMKTAQFNTWMLDLLGAIRRLSNDDHEVIKECCVILNRVFTTVEFIDTMKTLAKEPEKLGQYILDKEEEEMKISEKEPEKLGQDISNKQEEEVKIYKREPEKLDQRILDKKEEEKEIFEKEPEKLCKQFLNEEDEKMKIFEKEAEQFGQPLLNENIMFWIWFMLSIAYCLILSVVFMYVFNFKNEAISVFFRFMASVFTIFDFFSY